MSFVLLALGALVLFAWLVLRRRTATLPGEVIYRDEPDAPTLVSQRHRLRGRPDYVTREKRGLVPVEVKSRALGDKGSPYDGERAQVLAYCLLAEEDLGGPVSHGLLQYRDRSVVVPFGDRDRQEISRLLAEMQATQQPHRSHQQAAKCRRCGFRSQCSEALA